MSAAESAGEEMRAREVEAEKERRRVEERESCAEQEAVRIEGLRCQLKELQQILSEKDSRLVVLDQTVESNAALISARTEELTDMKKHLHSLKESMELAVEKANRAEEQTAVARQDLSALSTQYIRSQEDRTEARLSASEHIASSEKHQEELRDALLALEGRDAQLSSYADHVDMVEKKLTEAEQAAACLQSDLQDAVRALTQVRLSTPHHELYASISTDLFCCVGANMHPSAPFGTVTSMHHHHCLLTRHAHRRRQPRRY